MTTINEFMAKLPKLSPAQLQATAQANKDNAIFVGAVLAEKQRREKLDLARRATGQEQPKVVDEVIASMAPQQLPEDMGIGRLNAGNMNFAGGGIIAFADGGDVERYQAGGITAKYQQESMEMGMGTRMQYSPEVQAYAQAQEQASKEGYAERERQRMLQGPYGGISQAAPTAVAQPTQTPVAPNYSPDNLSGMDRRLMAGSQPSIASFKTPLPPKAGAAAPTADTGRKAPGAGLGAAAAAKADAGPSDIDALQQKYFGALDQDTGTLRNARAGLVAGIKDLTEQNLAATKADIEKRGDVYKGREARLAEQEKGLAGMGDKNMGLALLQAGAAMMTTPGGLGAALGKGVQVGSERYAAGLDKIEAAKSKFAEARDRLDDLRINRDDMNAKDIRAAEKEVRESKLKGEELLYNGLVSDLGIKQKNVTAIFGAAANALQSDKEIASRERTSKEQIAAANRTPAEIQMVERVMKEKNIPFTEALALLSSSKREGVSEEKLRGEWLDTAKRMQIAQDYPNVKTFEDYKTVMGMGGGGGGFKVVGVRQSP